jgi:protein-S-isoprenylcysteine O-methyltransferase Ste14
MKLATQTAASMVIGLIFFGVVLFLPAWTFHYWQAWVFIAVFSASTVIPSIYLAVTNPDALRRRLHAGPTAETRTTQKFVMIGTTLSVVAIMVISALDHRFGWSDVPTPLVVAGNVLVGVGLALAQFVVIQNGYAAATIRVEDDQPLVSTGLYGMVRHPLYVGALIMMVGTPFALDSYWGLIAIVPGLLALCVRILDEEKMLRQDLAGYDAYMHDVRYRLVPYVW